LSNLVSINRTIIIYNSIMLHYSLSKNLVSNNYILWLICVEFAILIHLWKLTNRNFYSILGESVDKTTIISLFDITPHESIWGTEA